MSGAIRSCFSWWLLSSLCIAGAPIAEAAEAPAKGAKGENKLPPLTAEEIKKLTEKTEEINRPTSDGVYLNGTYFRPDQAGRETSVIVLLHSKGGSQVDWFPFAKQLKDKGFAVITFDFRGHGASKAVNREIYLDPVDAEKGGGKMDPDAKPKENAAAREKKKKPIDFDKDFRKGAHSKNLVRDLDTIKTFILEQHNAGALNVQRLGLVAADEMSSNVAMEFAGSEYKKKVGWAPGGGDLHAMVLINPSVKYKDWTANVEFDDKEPIDKKVPILLVSRDDRGVTSEVERLARPLNIRPQESEAKGNDRPESTWIKIKSNYNGTDLVRSGSDGVEGKVLGFLKFRLVDRPDFVWKQRELNSDAGGGFGQGR